MDVDVIVDNDVVVIVVIILMLVEVVVKVVVVILPDIVVTVVVIVGGIFNCFGAGIQPCISITENIREYSVIITLNSLCILSKF
ncbi:MAG: hypothetical protein DRO92_01445 [Candidatus Altiarchaeales archaeon]|nr:MAG: hypothetical protein DRO92_01445 [Candidatus Altiarchaeales archaeon]